MFVCCDPEGDRLLADGFFSATTIHLLSVKSTRMTPNVAED